MQYTWWSYRVLLEGSVIATTAMFAFVLLVTSAFDRSTIATAIALGASLGVSVGLSSWWIFRRLQGRMARRESRRAASVFAVLTPFGLAAAMPLALIPAGIAEAISESLWPRHGIRVISGAAFMVTYAASVAMIVSLANFLPGFLLHTIGRQLAGQSAGKEGTPSFTREAVLTLRNVSGRRLQVTFDDGITQVVDISAVDDEGFLHSGPDGIEPAHWWTTYSSVIAIAAPDNGAEALNLEDPFSSPSR